MTSPFPLILCGRTTQIGQNVINALKPDYEVIHFIQSTTRSVIELPYLLGTASAVPPPRTDAADGERNIGSQNYSAPAQAILLGGGYSDNDIRDMRDACKGLRSVAWVRPDMTAEMPPPSSPDYGRLMVERSKVALAKLSEKGEMGRDAVLWY